MAVKKFFRRLLGVGRFEGRVGPVALGAIHGWIVDRRQPAARVAFTLYIDGVAVGDFVTGIERASLHAAGFGDGRHGFSVPIDPAWCTSGFSLIRVRPRGRRLLPHALKARLSVPGAPAARPAKGPEREGGQIIQTMRSLLRPKAETQALVQKARALFKGKQWPELAALAEGLPPFAKPVARLYLLVGRGLIYERRHDEASGVFAAGAADMAEDAEWSFYHGIALSRGGRHEEGVALLAGLVARYPRDAKYLGELASAQRAFGKSLGSISDKARGYLLQSLETTRTRMRVEWGGDYRARLFAARILQDLRQFADAVAELDLVIDAKPLNPEAVWLRSQCLVSIGRLADALADAKRVLAINPVHQGAAYQVRILQGIAHLDGERPAGTLAWLDPEPVAGGGLADRLRALGSTWVSFDRASGGTRPADRLRGALNDAPAWAGRLIVDAGGGERLELWRIALLEGLLASGYLQVPDRLQAELAELSPLVATAEYPGQTERLARPPIPAHAGQRVICMSRHGVVRFGGGEHFIESVAQYYESQGLRPLVAGARSTDAPHGHGELDGRDYVFLPATDAALRRLFIEERPAFVHVLSGLGYEVGAALEYLSIPFVYGVHFWRDCLGTSDMDVRHFTDGDRGPIPRQAFRYVISRAAVLYANSTFTRDILEQAFGFRAPVVYSLPDDNPPSLPAGAGPLAGLRDYVLLLNAKPEKGFDLLLDLAERLPGQAFVAVASQSSLAEAQVLVQERSLANVHIIEKIEQPGLLYRDALAVVAPSYQFIETFSRVCIEAQRYGRPVIGSDKGNVPYLLQESGVILPEVTDLWVDEIRRLGTDADYRKRREVLARENAARYSHALQVNAIRGLVGTLTQRVLIAVGSGVGNMLHVGPTIRAIARHLGHKVDIVVAEEYRESLFLLHDPQHVNAVFALGRHVLDRYYDIVFVTSCFGEFRPAFAGRQVLFARDWQKFEPGGSLHETVYNLESARQLLGVAYEPGDALDYYIGTLTWNGGGGRPLIGFHGGSKTGFWASKRWPGFAELAERLKARGFECASFGTADEYVEGTLDMTGGSLVEMATAMRACRYFISNDSGVMNIANAMGLPVAAIFAPTNVETRGPLRPGSSAVVLRKYCSPCEVTDAGRAIFQSGACRCIGEITVDEVDAHVMGEMRRLGLLAVTLEAAAT